MAAAERHVRRDLEPTIPADLLDLSDEEFRRLGHWVVDRTARHLATLRERPAITTGEIGDLDAALGGPLPQSSAPVDEGLGLLADVALEHQQHGDHPRYFARVPGPSSHVAILGEWLATGMQAMASSWGGGSGTAMLEFVALDWLRDALGLAPGSDGILLSGGSMANTTALLVARAEQARVASLAASDASASTDEGVQPRHTDPGILFLSDQTHSSIARGALAMGWPADRVQILPTDTGGALAAATLAEAAAATHAPAADPATPCAEVTDGAECVDGVAGRAAGRATAPRGVVVATVGTTNTGAVDDLAAIATVCREHGLWLHVDGAYGGPAALVDRGDGRRVVPDLDLADSFVLDPHKWLFQPYDIGCLWVAHPGALERTFAMHPEYLRDAQSGGAHGGRVDLHNRSLELTRRSRAAKLWLTVRSYGIDTLADAVRRGIELGEAAQALVEADPRLELVTPARLGVVTFGLAEAQDDGVTGRPVDDALPARVAAAVTADGYAALTSTVLHDRSVLRLCTINPRTTVAEIARTLELVGYAADRLR